MGWDWLVTAQFDHNMAQLRFSNVNGFPNLEAVSVTSDGTNTTVAFNSYPLSQSNRFFGGFWVKIPQAVAAGTEPLLFTTVGVNGSTVPVYLSDGTQATVASIATSGGSIFLFFYDRDSGRVQKID